MKLFIINIFLLVIFSSTFAKKMLCNWGVNYYTSTFAMVQSSVYDADSNLYITGNFYDTLIIDTFVLISQNKADAFVAKINKNKKCEWINQINGTRDQKGVSVVEYKNILYFVISFQDSIQFNNHKYLSLGNNDLLLICLNNNGFIKWDKVIKSSQADGVFESSLSINKNDCSLVATLATGVIGEYTYFGSDSIFDFTGSITVIIDTNGVLNSYFIYSNVLCYGILDKICLFGKIGDQLTYLDSVTAIGYQNGNQFVGRLFIAALDTANKVKWARIIAGDNVYTGQSVLGSFNGAVCNADKDSNIYIAGYATHADLIFHNGYKLKNWDGGGINGFIAKYNKDGDFLWAKNVGNCQIDAIDLDSFGNIYLGGYSMGCFHFAKDTFNCNRNGFFICKYAPNGDSLWGYVSDGDAGARATSIHVTSPDHIIVTGVTGSTLCAIDTVNMYNELGTGSDAFIASIYMDTSIHIPMATNHFTATQSEIEWFPNPTNDYIKLNSNIVFESLEIINLNGKILDVIKHPNINSIYTNKYADGIYIFKLINNKTVCQQKIIIHH